MIMDCEKYVGKCVCGRDHELETKKVVVEYGAINNFEQYMADVGLAGKKRAVIYDTVIYKLTEGKHVAADQEIVLEANGLRAEDTVIEEMMKKLDNPEVIVAYGARHHYGLRPLPGIQARHSLRRHPDARFLRRLHGQYLLGHSQRSEEVHTDVRSRPCRCRP